MRTLAARRRQELTTALGFRPGREDATPSLLIGGKMHQSEKRRGRGRGRTGSRRPAPTELQPLVCGARPRRPRRPRIAQGSPAGRASLAMV